MSGFGISPFGVAPYGLGTPSTSSSNAGSPLTDVNGAQQGSRYIHPQSRRYVFDPNGRAVGAPNVPSLVQLALSTVFGSSSMPSLGDPAPGGVIGSSFDAKRKVAITNALAALVRDKLIVVRSIDVNSKLRPVKVVITWTDLTTRLEQETVI